MQFRQFFDYFFLFSIQPTFKRIIIDFVHNGFTLTVLLFQCEQINSEKRNVVYKI